MSTKKILNKFHKWDKHIYTFIIGLINLTFGISDTSFGPALVDLKHILNTSIDKISIITFFLTSGYMIGSLFGLLYEYLNRQLSLIILLVLMGISIASIPYSYELSHLYLCAWIFGLGGGAWGCAKNVWLIEIWKSDCAPFLQLSGLMFGLGSIISPLIERPFLTGELSNTSKNLISNKLSEEVDRRTKLKKPFLTIGIIHMIGPVLLMMMYLLKRNKNRIPKTRIFDENRSKRILNYRNRLMMIIGVSIFLAFYGTAKSIHSHFSATYYQFSPLKLTAIQSAELVSSCALSYTIGRGINVFIAFKIKPQIMIAYHFLILFIGITFLSLGQNSTTILWIGSLIMGFGFSSINYAILSLVGQHIDVTNAIGTIIIFSSHSLHLFIPFILGKYIEKFPNIFILCISINLTISCCVYMIMLYLIIKSQS